MNKQNLLSFTHIFISIRIILKLAIFLVHQKAFSPRWTYLVSCELLFSFHSVNISMQVDHLISTLWFLDPKMILCSLSDLDCPIIVSIAQKNSWFYGAIISLLYCCLLARHWLTRKKFFFFSPREVCIF